MTSNRDHLLPAPGNHVPSHEHPHTACRTKSSMNISPVDNRGEGSGGPAAANQSQGQTFKFHKSPLTPSRKKYTASSTTSCGYSSVAAGASSIKPSSSSPSGPEESGNRASARIWARRWAAWEASPDVDAEGSGNTSSIWADSAFIRPSGIDSGSPGFKQRMLNYRSDLVS